MATKRIVWTDQIPPELLAAARAELPAGFELAVLSPARDTWAAELAGADVGVEHEQRRLRARRPDDRVRDLATVVLAPKHLAVAPVHVAFDAD